MLNWDHAIFCDRDYSSFGAIQLTVLDQCIKQSLVAVYRLVEDIRLLQCWGIRSMVGCPILVVNEWYRGEYCSFFKAAEQPKRDAHPILETVQKSLVW